MEFFKKLRGTSQSCQDRDQTKPSTASAPDSQNNLIVQQSIDVKVQNADVKLAVKKPYDLSHTYKSHVGNLYGRQVAPAAKRQAPPMNGPPPVTRHICVTGPVVLPRWEDIEDLEEKLEENVAEFEKERIELRRANSVLMRKLQASETEFEKERNELRRGNSVLVRKLEAAEQSKNALVKHVIDMKEKLTRGRHIISALKNSEAKAIELHRKQKNMINSLLAVRERTKTTRLISGNHRVANVVMAPSAMVCEEMSLAADRQRQEVARLASVVDTLSVRYSGDRYSNVSTIITNPPAEPETCVPDEFMGLWLFTVEPTQEELEMYERVLEKQVRPPPIHSPNLPRPRIQWTRLNTNMFRNLPKPEKLRIYSCSQDPAFYGATQSTGYGGTMKVFEAGTPFGTMYGFMTDMGAVPVPEESIHGYKFSPELGTWVIAASGTYR